MYLGQVSKSADNANKGTDKDITKGLTFNKNNIFVKKMNKKKTKIRLKIINEYCQPDPKINFANEIKSIGVV
tara:strand:- start:783 stop:998 length:216 start_codon:yes stop_codon:yes gene_type:complete